MVSNRLISELKLPGFLFQPLDFLVLRVGIGFFTRGRQLVDCGTAFGAIVGVESD